MTDQDLSGMVAVVTGASRGIGKGIAIELGSRGTTVYVTGRTTNSTSATLPGTVSQTADDVSAAGGVGIPIICDHHNDNEIRDLFAQVKDEQGGLDVLVNNVFPSQANIDGRRGRFWEEPIELWDELIDISLRAHYVAAAMAVPLMHGRNALITNISSSGARDYMYIVAYGVAKAGVDKFTADAAHELRDEHIAVISLWPGVTRTELIEYLANSDDPSLNEITHGIVDPPSARFVGKAVASLLLDPNVAEHSGKHIPVTRVAQMYGFVDN